MCCFNLTFQSDMVRLHTMHGWTEWGDCFNQFCFQRMIRPLVPLGLVHKASWLCLSIFVVSFFVCVPTYVRMYVRTYVHA